MKFTVHTPQFINVASSVLKGLNAKDVTSQTNMEILDNKLHIQSSSSKYFFKGSVELLKFEADEDEQTKWNVDGNQLKTILSILTKEDNSFEFNMSNTNKLFEVKQGSNKFKLPVYEVSPFEREEKRISIGKVDAMKFMENVLNVSKLATTSDVTQMNAVSCLNISSEDDKLVYSASNGIAVVEVKQHIEDSEEFTILIKPSEASLLLSNQFNAGDVVEIYQTNNMFGYIDTNGTLSLVAKAKLEPLSFKPFQSFAFDDKQVEFDTKEFKHTIDSLIKLAPNNIELDFKFDNEVGTVVNGNMDQIQYSIKTNEIEETELKLHKPTLSLLMPLLTEKTRFSWVEKGAKKLIKISPLTVDDTPVSDVFIGIQNRGDGVD